MLKTLGSALLVLGTVLVVTACVSKDSTARSQPTTHPALTDPQMRQISPEIATREAVDAIALIRSSKAEDREQGRKMILKERGRVVEALIDIIKAPRRNEDSDRWLDRTSSRNTAIACIAVYRAPEAVPALLPLLDAAPGEVVFFWEKLGLCPAGEALVQIGKPSVAAVIGLLAGTEAKTMVAGQVRGVLHAIEGTEPGEKALKDALAEEKDAARRGRLEAHLKEFHDLFAGH